MSGAPMKRAIGRSAPLAVLSALGAIAVFALASLGTGAGGRPPVRRVARLPSLTAKAARARNVLLVLTEGVRFDSVCVDYRADCRLTPFTNRLAESRFPLLETRSVSSSTAISV